MSTFTEAHHDVRVYNRVLSATEVKSIYDGLAASPAGSPGGAVSATVILNGQATFGAGTRIN